MHLSVSTCFSLLLNILVHSTPTSASTPISVTPLPTPVDLDQNTSIPAAAPSNPKPSQPILILIPTPTPNLTPAALLQGRQQLEPPLAGGVIPSPLPSTGQAPATTTYPIYSFNSHGGVALISVPFTQTFSPGPPEQWPGPSKGSIGIETITVTSSYTHPRHTKADDGAPTPFTTSAGNRQGRETDIGGGGGGVNQYIQGMPVRGGTGTNATSHLTFTENKAIGRTVVSVSAVGVAVAAMMLRSLVQRL